LLCCCEGHTVKGAAGIIFWLSPLLSTMHIRRFIIVGGLILSLAVSAMGVTIMSPACPMAAKRSGCPKCATNTSRSIKTKSCCVTHEILLRVDHKATLAKVSSDAPLPMIVVAPTLLFPINPLGISQTTLSESSDPSPPVSILILRI
jgi:hypothetical protein